MCLKIYLRTDGCIELKYWKLTRSQSIQNYIKLCFSKRMSCDWKWNIIVFGNLLNGYFEITYKKKTRKPKIDTTIIVCVLNVGRFPVVFS